MPVRHVHFADHHEAFYYPPSPSDSDSDASLPSTPGPLTPPPLTPLGLGLPASLDDSTPGVVRINPILGFSTHPFISLDLRDHPSSTSLSPSEIAQPATKPSLSVMRIVSPYLPWQITIPASSGTVVTVGDVLGGLCAALRFNVKEREFDDMPSYDYRRRTSKAYLARCARFVGVRADEEKRQGVKRVDFLMGMNRWMGLSSTTLGPDVWQLVVS